MKCRADKEQILIYEGVTCHVIYNINDFELTVMYSTIMESIDKKNNDWLVKERYNK